MSDPITQIRSQSFIQQQLIAAQNSARTFEIRQAGQSAADTNSLAVDQLYSVRQRDDEEQQSQQEADAQLQQSAYARQAYDVSQASGSTANQPGAPADPAAPPQDDYTNSSTVLGYA